MRVIFSDAGWASLTVWWGGLAVAPLREGRELGISALLNLRPTDTSIHDGDYAKRGEGPAIMGYGLYSWMGPRH